MVAESDNLEESATFWRHLGFKPISTGNRVIQLDFTAPLRKESCHLYLRKRKPRTHVFALDAQGFNCIAFISTDLEKDRRNFEAIGMRPTETKPFRVNGRDLRIFWVRGPCGEIAEIIGLT